MVLGKLGESHVSPKELDPISGYTQSLIQNELKTLIYQTFIKSLRKTQTRLSTKLTLKDSRSKTIVLFSCQKNQKQK